MAGRLLGFVVAVAMAAPASAAASGAIVGRGEGPIVSRATTVVAMRHERRTVLTVSSSYEGPAADFAMIVPVPVPVRREDVRVLPRGIVDLVVGLAAPRLADTWERDPCDGGPDEEPRYTSSHAPEPGYRLWRADLIERDHGVTVVARYPVGEYDLEILGARRSRRLVAWLRERGYQVPAGAEELLRAHVQAGSFFMVAKVAIERAGRAGDGTVRLSALQYTYESDDLRVPIGFGLLNGGVTEDVVVHVLARERHQAVGRANVALASELGVNEATRAEFPRFYAALLDRTLALTPGAVVTEYATQSELCASPCLVMGLNWAELDMLGGDLLWRERRPDIPREPDVLPTNSVEVPGDDPFQPSERRAILGRASRHPPSRAMYRAHGMVLTRLHLRRGPGDGGGDLVLQPAPAIVGGEPGAPPAGELNAFAARYLIRHPWDGPITCLNPRRGRWDAPGTRTKGTRYALGAAFVAQDADLAEFLVDGVEALPAPAVLAVSASPPELAPGCGRCDAGSGAGGPGVLVITCLGLRRRRGSGRQRAAWWSTRVA